MRDICQEYASILAAFLDFSLTAREFQAAFQNKFQNEQRSLDEDVFLLLDRVFADAEVFSEDVELIARRPHMYIDGDELRRRVEMAAEDLKAMIRRKTN